MSKGLNMETMSEKVKDSVKVVTMVQIFDYSVFVRNSENKIEESYIRNTKPCFYAITEDLSHDELVSFVKSRYRKVSLADVAYVIEYKVGILQSEFERIKKLSSSLEDIILKLFKMNLILQDNSSIVISASYPLILCNDNPMFRVMQ